MLKKKKILIVDDEPDAISYMESVLEENSYDHVSADNGVEGLEIARNVKPDLILLDLIMPEKSGILMFQELKKDPDLAPIPVIVVSGASEVTGVDLKNFMIKLPYKVDKRVVETSGETRFATPNAFVEKPVNPDELISAIEDNLKK